MRVNSKSVVLVLIISVLSFDSISQEPAKPTYENKVIEENGRYYIQKSLPVYLKFSVTPDGKNYPLKSASHPSDANPMYLDTEGQNLIRSKWAVDPATGNSVYPPREVEMEIYADGKSPLTSVRFDGASRYTSGGTTYYGPGLNITLSASDAVSGVSETQYALNGAYQKYSSPFQSSKEGVNNLYFFSADKVGNAERTNPVNYTVDLNSPQSSHAIEGIVHNGNIIAPSTRFRITTTDNLSGVRSVHYSFDDNSSRGYTPTIGVSSLVDGDHTLYYYSVDNVRNEAGQQSFKFYLDKIPPSVISEVIGDQHQTSNYLYVSSRTQVGLSATDNKAGVHKIYYRIDGGERFDYANNFYFPNALGKHSIKYDATDNVENLSPNKYLNVYLDNLAPETGIFYGNPQFFHRDTLFITSSTSVTLRSRDVHAGVQSLVYAIDNSNFSEYNIFTIPGEGPHTVKFYATDNVNNQESAKTSRITVDNTPPNIFVNFSIDPIGSKGNLKVYPNYVRMYVGATDKKVGTDRLQYSIDGSALTDYSSPQTLDISELSKFRQRKKYEVRVVATDKLGNKSEKTFEFYVGRVED
ncbi:MAG: hypothetical protein HKN92_10860 [Chitinophagales bacterium]|nr:hypothetical protein [Chitinophagales bacterium]